MRKCEGASLGVRRKEILWISLRSRNRGPREKRLWWGREGRHSLLRIRFTKQRLGGEKETVPTKWGSLVVRAGEKIICQPWGVVA